MPGLIVFILLSISLSLLFIDLKIERSKKIPMLIFLLLLYIAFGKPFLIIYFDILAIYLIMYFIYKIFKIYKKRKS